MKEKILNNNISSALNKQLVQKIPVLTLLSINPMEPTRWASLKGCLNNTDEYSERFCVIDVDQHQNLEKALSSAAKNGISIVVTNIKFEVWLLWHIDDFPNSYMSSSDINKRIKNICKKFPFMTGRNNKNLHSSFPIGNYHEASIRAKRRDPNMAFNKKGPNPSSAMPLLIDKIKNG